MFLKYKRGKIWEIGTLHEALAIGKKKGKRTGKYLNCVMRLQKTMTMNISKEHIELAERIDNFVTTIFKNGGSEEQILTNMYDYMHDFKFLMNNLPKGGMDVLCSRYDGFYRFAKLIEKIAEGLSSGKIKV